jgi:hypothetical protein
MFHYPLTNRRNLTLTSTSLAQAVAPTHIYGVFFIQAEPAISDLRRIITGTGAMLPAEIVRLISKSPKRI